MKTIFLILLLCLAANAAQQQLISRIKDAANKNALDQMISTLADDKNIVKTENLDKTPLVLADDGDRRYRTRTRRYRRLRYNSRSSGSARRSLRSSYGSSRRYSNRGRTNTRSGTRGRYGNRGRYSTRGRLGTRGRYGTQGRNGMSPSYGNRASSRRPTSSTGRSCSSYPGVQVFAKSSSGGKFGAPTKPAGNYGRRYSNSNYNRGFRSNTYRSSNNGRWSYRNKRPAASTSYMRSRGGRYSSYRRSNRSYGSRRRYGRFFG